MSTVKIITLLLFLVSIGQLHPAFAQMNKEWEIQTATYDEYAIAFTGVASNYLKTVTTSTNEFVTLGHRAMEFDSTRRMIYLFKFNSQGEIIWEYTYDSRYKVRDQAIDMTIDSEDNLIIAAKASSYYLFDIDVIYETAHYLLLKISPDGQLIWELELPSEDQEVSYCASVTVDENDQIYTTGFIFMGGNHFSILNKISPDGQTLWTQYPDQEIGSRLELINDQLVLITVNAYSAFEGQLYKYSKDGIPLFSKSLEGARWQHVLFDEVGNIYRFFNVGDYFFQKYDPSVNLLWEYTKPTNLPPNNCCDYIVDCHVDPRGDILLTGQYFGDSISNTSADILTTRLSSDGLLQWEDVYHFDHERSWQSGIQVTADTAGFVYVLGRKSKSTVILTYDWDGRLVDSTFNLAPQGRYKNPVRMLNQGEHLYIMGWTDANRFTIDQEVIKYSKTITSTSPAPLTKSFKVYPNPSDGQTLFVECQWDQIDLTITDLLGRIVYEHPNFDCSSEAIDAPLKKGHYVLSIQTAQGIQSQGISIR